MSKTKLIVSIMAIAALSSAAAADGYDAPLKQTAAPQTFNWSGLYLGGHVGYGWADIGSSFDLDVDVDTPDNFLNRFGQDIEGWMGGGHIGVQHQHGNWVFGIEGTYDALNLDGSSSAAWEFNDSVCTPSPLPACINLFGAGTQSVRTEIDNLITITGRIGYAWDHWLTYLKGGYARAEVGLSGSLDGMLGSCPGCSPPVNVSGSSQKDHDGWTVGAGAEYRLHENLTMGFEYVYVKLSSETHAVEGEVGVSPATLAIDVDPEAIHAVSGRLSIFLNQ